MVAVFSCLVGRIAIYVVLAGPPNPLKSELINHLQTGHKHYPQSLLPLQVGVWVSRNVGRDADARAAAYKVA
jgi:hypothetical protein